MILQALADYYKILVSKDRIPPFGWAIANISFALEIDRNGDPVQLLPMFETEERKGKPVQVPGKYMMPAPVKRTAGVAANFLYDNPQYVLGLPKEDKKKTPGSEKKNAERALETFRCMSQLHLELLKDCTSDAAAALKNWFGKSSPGDEGLKELIAPFMKELSEGGNITYFFEGKPVTQYPEIAEAWNTAYNTVEDGPKSVCLITGEKIVPEPVHPSIKGVSGASTMGAAIVSFNAPSFCSYDKEQSLNAPVGKNAAFAYTSALNYLLGDFEHKRSLGDSTIVYWAEDGEEAYQDLFGLCLDGSNDTITDADLRQLIDKLAAGEAVDFDAARVTPTNRFYILAISPNNARLAIRFFLNSCFGDMIRHIKEHMDRLEITDGPKNLPIWRMLKETVRSAGGKSDDPLPHLSGDMLRSIMTGGPYPATLYQQVQIRIRAEHSLTRAKAAIIKAYLLRNGNDPKYQEVLGVKLNEETTYMPYVLGELFSVLENIQETASGVTTIKDHYFTSACQTPATVFPRLIDLAQKHLRKMNDKSRIYFSKQMQELIGKLDSDFPVQLNLNDQGVFQIGYYHKTQARYTKKEQ